jgi:hypothetical protein
MEGIRMISFSPLPHEFGLRINVVPASISAAWVAGWEIGNTVRMVEQVLREGGIPIFSYVSVRFAFSGSELVAVGGSSHVYFIKREDQQNFQQNPNQSFASPDLSRQNFKTSKPQFGLLDKVPLKNGKTSGFHQEESGGEDLSLPDSVNLQQDLFSLLAFLSLRDEQVAQEMRDEVLRDYLLFLSGLISKEQFARKIRDFDMKAKTGLFISIRV